MRIRLWGVFCCALLFAAACAPAPGSQPPRISGVPVVGGDLTATAGEWVFNPSDYVFTWSSCAAVAPSDCHGVGGNSAHYSPTAPDVGRMISVDVRASNPAGSTSRSSPAVGPVRGGVTAVAAGDTHSCALLADGTAKCWGDNQYGQLGDGTTTDTLVPVAVSGLSGAVAITTGFTHSCALLADGTAKCWGDNQEGQLGDGTTTASLVPVAVSGLSGAVAISAGTLHSCAVLSDNTARCWGNNGASQLGDGTITGSPLPVAVSGLSGAVAIAAGTYYSCALLADGTAKCWGSNSEGQLGTPTVEFVEPEPVTVSGLSDAVAITTGVNHACALLADGTAKCWGDNFFGQLGNGQSGTGTGGMSIVPVTVSGLSGAVAITAAGAHSCAVLVDGTARCWGNGEFGQLGDGTGTGSPLPVAVSGLSGASSIATGEYLSLALLGDGTVKWWGTRVSVDQADPSNFMALEPETVAGLP